MNYSKKRKGLIITVVLVIVGVITMTVSMTQETQKPTPNPMPTAPSAFTPNTVMVRSTPTPFVVPLEEIEAVALTLAGECYEDETNDKQKVVEVILNRVSDGRFGDSVIEVIAAKNQFAGFYTQSREVSENDRAIAESVLNEWYKNGCQAFSDYLYFSAGQNHKNTFRKEFNND